MSGLFGIIRFDGEPVSIETLHTMRQAMAFWGADSSTLWSEDGAGLGHLCSQRTSETQAGPFPLYDAERGLAFAGQGRIDNRDELLSALARQAGEAIANQTVDKPVIVESQDTSLPRSSLVKKISDDRIIYHSYLYWGEESVHHLTGDWSFAAWDARQRKLFLARDQHGISSIYYCRQPHLFAFASSIKALLALPEIPKRPNLLQVARVLVAWQGVGVQTAYENIFQLPPAHTLTLTIEKLDTRRYWFLENAPTLRLASDDEYLDAFLEIYSAAVRSRLYSPFLSGDGNGGIGATLSSGLDSGSVCALASRQLGKDGKRLPVFTAIPLYDTPHLSARRRCSNEAPLVELQRQFFGNIDVHYIRSEDVSPLAGMERALEIHDSPGHAAGNAFWIMSLLGAVQQQGLSILLIGQSGNATISWKGGVESLWPLLLPGRWSALRDLPRRLGLPLWKIVWRHYVRPVLLPPFIQAIRLRSLGQDPWITHSAINPRYGRSLNLTRQMRTEGHDPLFIPPSDPRQARLELIRPGQSNMGAIWAETGAAFGLEVRDPTIDQRLMEFCLAIPDEQYRLEALDRSLIRRAMQGLLPDAVRLNTQRGLQAADLGYRLLAELPQVEMLMARLEKSVLASDVLDLPKMKGVLQALQREVNLETTVQSVNILTRGMMAGMFLLRFDGP